MLLSGSKVLAGSLSTSKSWIYEIATNTWTQSGSKVYNERQRRGELGPPARRAR
jgi:hypothetical protein